MPLFLLNIFGFITAKWRLLLIGAGVIAVLVVVGMIFKACNKPPKLDEQQIQKAQQAIAEKDRKKMIDILAESAIVEKQIDANLANADNQRLAAASEARKRTAGKSNEELAAEIERLLSDQ